MAKIAVGCRVSESIAAELDEQAAKLGISRGAVIEDAIAQYLRRDTAPTLTNQIKDVLIRLTRLEEKHQALATLVVQPK